MNKLSVKEIQTLTKGDILTKKEIDLDKKIDDYYLCDLLSWVLGNMKENSCWITIHGHINIIAVAKMVDCPLIIVSEGASIEEETIKKANEENIIIISTNLSSFYAIKEIITHL